MYLTPDGDRTEQKYTFIGNYVSKSASERLEQLIVSYKDFERDRGLYKERVIDLMVAMREYHIKPSEEDLGVRVQTTGGTSNITASKALERVTLEECFKSMKISKEMFPDPDEYRLISLAVYEWDLMGREFGILDQFIKGMKEKDRDILLPYMRKEKGPRDLAEELCLEYDSARKRVYRIRKALFNKVLPWMNEYTITVPA